MRKSEERRFPLKLTPLPDHDIQEAILGYLATHSVDAAVERLRYWLDNSRVRNVSDVVQNHPAFRRLFGA